MPFTRRSISISLVSGVVALSSALAACGSSTTTAAAPEQKHIFYIMMENHGTDQIIGNTADAPYINQLASQYGVAMNYYGVTHPSLPNYLAAISGDYQGIWDDCKAGAAVTCAPIEFVQGDQTLTQDQVTSSTAQAHMFAGQNIIDQLETKKLTWKAYMQSMPSAGFTGEYYPTTTDATGNVTSYKLYAQKHNPFVYFSDVVNNPARMQNIVPFISFNDDMRQGHVPSFVWISPDQCHDMHGVSSSTAAAVGLPDCAAPATGLDHSTITLGDTYLSKVVPEIMHSPAFTKNSEIVIAWDENDYTGNAGCCKSPVGQSSAVLGGDRAPLLVINGSGAKHVTDDTKYNHYALLNQIEKEFGLSCLVNACDQASMEKLFHP